MPYIKKELRASIGTPAAYAGTEALTPGELNYAVTKVVCGYLTAHGVSYQRISEAISALECAKMELYRRVAAPYEDKKCAENGEVF